MPDSDEAVAHELGVCRYCGADLCGALVISVTCGQVFDIPPVKVTVIEHQMLERGCACGARTRGDVAPVQHGSHVAAIGLYLCIGQMLCKDRTAPRRPPSSSAPRSHPVPSAMLTARDRGGFLELVSDRLRTACGAKQFAAVRSQLATARKHTSYSSPP